MPLPSEACGRSARGTPIRRVSSLTRASFFDEGGEVTNQQPSRVRRPDERKLYSASPRSSPPGTSQMLRALGSLSGFASSGPTRGCIGRLLAFQRRDDFGWSLLAFQRRTVFWLFPAPRRREVVASQAARPG